MTYLSTTKYFNAIHKLNLQICYQIISKACDGNFVLGEVRNNFATDSPGARISVCRSSGNIYNRITNNINKRSRSAKCDLKVG